MTFTVLSLYNFFFIDESEKLWAVLKDGRLSLLKNVSSFSCFSSDLKGVVGVRFSGEKTAFYASDVAFHDKKPYLLMQARGYFYYPGLLVHPQLKLAAFKADLLNQKGCGDLTVFARRKGRFVRIYQLPARIHPAYWKHTDGTLIYLTNENKLVQTNFIFSRILASRADLFAVHESKGLLAVYNNDTIQILSQEGLCVKEFFAFHVTALCFAPKADRLFFATYKNDCSNLYCFYIDSGVVSLILSHSCRICTLSPQRQDIF